jgi:hypothetical protein
MRLSPVPWTSYGPATDLLRNRSQVHGDPGSRRFGIPLSGFLRTSASEARIARSPQLNLGIVLLGCFGVKAPHAERLLNRKS